MQGYNLHTVKKKCSHANIKHVFLGNDVWLFLVACRCVVAMIYPALTAHCHHHCLKKPGNWCPQTPSWDDGELVFLHDETIGGGDAVFLLGDDAMWQKPMLFVLAQVLYETSIVQCKLDQLLQQMQARLGRDLKLQFKYCWNATNIFLFKSFFYIRTEYF